jgi:hypothetical protein
VAWIVFVVYYYYYYRREARPRILLFLWMFDDCDGGTRAWGFFCHAFTLPVSSNYLLCKNKFRISQGTWNQASWTSLFPALMSKM